MISVINNPFLLFISLYFLLYVIIKAVPLVLYEFIEDEPEMRLKGAAMDNKEENNKYIIKY